MDLAPIDFVPECQEACFSVNDRISMTYQLLATWFTILNLNLTLTVKISSKTVAKVKIL